MLLSPKAYMPVVAGITALITLVLLGIARLINLHVSISWKSFFIAVFVFITLTFFITWTGVIILDSVATGVCSNQKQ